MMKQVINELKQHLKLKKQHRIKQLEQQERLRQTLQNTENDIQQIEYTLHLLEKIKKNSRSQRIIHYADITDFFAHITRIFERIEQRERTII